MNAVRVLPLLGALLLVLPVATARAHFIWLVRQAEAPLGERIEMYFAESAEADDPDLLPRVKQAAVWRHEPGQAPQPLELQLRDERLFAPLADAPRPNSLFLARHDYGVLERGGQSFVLRYYARTGPELGAAAWAQAAGGKLLDLDLIPARVAEGVRIQALWQGQPLAGAQVKIAGPGLEDVEIETDQAGYATFAAAEPGLYSIRARHIEDQAGQREQQKFTSIRHYATLALPVPAAAVRPTDSRPVAKTAGDLPPLPELVTSFGGAILNDALYVYGGHTGRAHAYWDKAQANTLRRLDLKQGKAWETLGTGPGLQGLAMVAHGGRLYRLGGFAARNKEGDEHDLWSVADFASFDPRTRQWTELSPLPEARSSFDAAVLGSTLYVVGGWKLAGEAEAQWHTTAWKMDLSAAAPSWQPLPEPPFQRRALAVAAHQGKLFVIGGMQAEGGPTRRVDIFDPQQGTWTQGPDLQGERMDGFGASAFAAGDRLYASTYSGKLQRLAVDGQSWEVVRQLDRARFFHRMLPVSPERLILVGGASMEAGKFAEVDLVDVRAAD